MKAIKIKSYLEVVTDLAVLLVALLVFGTFVWNLWSKHSSIQPSPGLIVGKYFPELRGLDYDRSPKTILIAMSTGCDFCTHSTPFYKQLTEAQRERNSPVHIVGLFPESERTVDQFLHQYQLSIDRVSNVDFTSLNVAGTPIIIVVDSRGRILNFWVGQLSKDAEQEIIKTIS